MKVFLAAWIYIGSGAAFWLPSVVVHAIRGFDFGNSRFDIIAVLLLPVLAAILVLELLDRYRIGGCRRRMIAGWMLFGIWFLGPLMMNFGATFSGGGFARPGTWQTFVSAATLFIPFTWMMSAYDGTLGALVVITVWLVIVALRGLTFGLSLIVSLFAALAGFVRSA